MLFSASLEAHMKAYMNQVRLEEINIEYQKMENKIIQDGLRMQMSQADILNKVDQMKEELIQQTIAKIIPFEQTAAPEIIKEEEKYKPLTTSEYENILRKSGKKVGETYKTSKEINELAKMAENDLLPVIRELKDYRKQRKEFEEELINMTNERKRLIVKNNLNKLKKKEEKKMEFINNKIMKSEDLLNSIQNRLANLRPAERNTYKEPISKFKQELEEAIRERNKLKINIPSNRSSQAPTETSTLASPDTSPIINTIKRKGNWMTQKNEIQKKLTTFYNDYDVPQDERIKINKYTTQNELLNHEKKIQKKYGSIWL